MQESILTLIQQVIRTNWAGVGKKEPGIAVVHQMVYVVWLELMEYGHHHQLHVWLHRILQRGDAELPGAVEQRTLRHRPPEASERGGISFSLRQSSSEKSLMSTAPSSLGMESGSRFS